MKKVKKDYMEKQKEKNKWLKSNRLYIVSAISMATICVVTLIVISQISKSVTKVEEKTMIPILTPMPMDTVINSPFLDTNKQVKQSPQPTEKTLPTVAPTIAPVVKDEQVVETGLFHKEPNKFRIALPVHGGVLNEYSMDKLKKSKTMGDWRVHKGVDIKGDIGTAVLAAASGVVEKAYFDSALGNTIVIKHNDSYQTIYSNLTTIEMVEIGQNIKQGDCIGAIGDSAVFEKLEDAHMHFELLENGKNQDPLLYIKE